MSFTWKVVTATGVVFAVGAVLLVFSMRGDEREVEAALQEAVDSWNESDADAVAAYVSPDFSSGDLNAAAAAARIRDLISERRLTNVEIERADITVMGEQATVGLRLAADSADAGRRVVFHIDDLRLERTAGEPTWRVTYGELRSGLGLGR